MRVAVALEQRAQALLGVHSGHLAQVARLAELDVADRLEAVEDGRAGPVSRPVTTASTSAGSSAAAARGPGTSKAGIAGRRGAYTFVGGVRSANGKFSSFNFQRPGVEHPQLPPQPGCGRHNL